MLCDVECGGENAGGGEDQRAVKELGAVKTSVYIYMVPVITVVTSAVILHERVTPVSAAGTALAVAGLFLSEYEGKNKENGFTE